MDYSTASLKLALAFATTTEQKKLANDALALDTDNVVATAVVHSELEAAILWMYYN